MRQTLTLRPATEDDADFLRALRNDPVVVAASRTNKPVDKSTHRNWLAGSIDSSTRRLLVVCDSSVPIGQARLDTDSDGEWVSIAFVQEQRGRGHGSEVLKALQRLADQDLLAEIRTSNSSSLSLFRRVGFEELGEDGGFTELRWTNPTERVGETPVTAVSVGEHAD